MVVEVTAVAVVANGAVEMAVVDSVERVARAGDVQ